MLAFADSEFQLSAVQKDGSTLRAQYESHWRQSGEMPDQLIYEPCPEELKYLWELYQKIAGGRDGGGFGIAPLTWLNIEAWSRLSRVSLLPFEVEAITQLDVVFRNSQSKADK